MMKRLHLGLPTGVHALRTDRGVREAAGKSNDGWVLGQCRRLVSCCHGSAAAMQASGRPPRARVPPALAGWGQVTTPAQVQSHAWRRGAQPGRWPATAPVLTLKASQYPICVEKQLESNW
jgi:hypothetical protein